VIVSENQESTPGNEIRGTQTSRHIIGWSGIVIALALVLGIIIQLLWTWLMPEIFGLGRITILQGIGLLVLARLLFGRMGQRRDHAGYLTGKYGFKRPSWLGGSAKEDSAKGAIES
jgi:hypothetical protein